MKNLKLLCVATCLISLSGCYALGFGAAAGSGAKVAMQEKTVGTSMDETVLQAKISNAMLKEDTNKLFMNVNVNVNNGTVLLTGEVNDPDTILKAVQIAWNEVGFNEGYKVVNDIQLSKNTTADKWKNFFKDSAMTTEIKYKLLKNPDIHSVNYTVITINKVVHLVGLAPSEQEKRLVEKVVRRVASVKVLKNHIQVKHPHNHVHPAHTPAA